MRNGIHIHCPWSLSECSIVYEINLTCHWCSDRRSMQSGEESMNELVRRRMAKSCR